MGFLPFFSLETWTLLVIFISLFVTYGRWTYGIFEKLGIPCSKPVMYWGTIGKQNKVYYLADLENFQKYGRIWGMYEFKTPVLFVMDPDMIKAILVKECFSYFPNHREMPLKGDLYDALNFSEDGHWRRLRHLMSPSFSSGHIKEMCERMKHHSRKLTDSLRSKVQKDEVINIKHYFGAYSVDVMANFVFSVDMDTISTCSSPLLTHASKIFRISTLLFILQACFPFVVPILEMLGWSLFSKSSADYFRGLLEKIRVERDKSSGQTQRDFLQFMINSQLPNDSKGKEKHEGLTDHEILSQATMFVFAGYDTTASVLQFLAYDLARNPEVMRSLQEEIDSTFPDKAPIQYEALMQMEYLDCVINETLRLYPPAARLERNTKAAVKINGITIPKDMVVSVPVYALHRDPELWPEPENFDPDRFRKENKKNIKPYSYLPFGTGPRNCMGMRFAVVMVKVALVEVLQNYSFSVCEETEIPLEMDHLGLVGPLRPIKLKLVTRSCASENTDDDGKVEC
ncbi:cytochrome P450 3A56-like [Genypterus blacodes]|uniref:cytochrome P450 3A56-like n=1 Tax=Genypterus blacodes TaxID=154954 RepID=UPI003F76FF72